MARGHIHVGRRDLPRRDPFRAAGWPACGLVVLMLLGACAQSTEVPTLLPDASRLSTNADADDIDAAVNVAVGRVEMAILQTIRTSPDPRVLRIYELRAVTDEPAVLKVWRTNSDGEAGPVSLELAASFGRFGNPARERALLEAVRRRLIELRGVDVAPIR
jgi:hypothetical protein